MDINTDRLILIVTGAHLKAEASDRPLAYHLRKVMSDWLTRKGLPENPECPRVLVCSDVWYLNNEPLRSRPTVSIGGPGVNALSAYLGDKLPSAFSIENVLLVQAEIEFIDVVATCWGVDDSSTAAAVEAFANKYLDAFMTAATAD